MARLIKAGTPRALPPEGEYTPEEQLWLAAAEAAGKKAKGKNGKPAKTPDARSARRENARACREAVQGGKRSGQIIYACVTFVFDAALLALSTIALVGSTYNAFLYFRF